MIEDRLLGIQAAALQVQRQRLELIAGNLANADTPGFKARDLDFRAVLDAVQRAPKGGLFGGTPDTSGLETLDPLYRSPMQPSADGNTVEAQIEQGQYADAALRYQASLNFIDGRIKSMLTALTGQ
jgi:flagellar basal-body rod protein FlgB